MSYLIKYENIGRDKVTGSDIIKEISFDSLCKVFKKFFRSELEFFVDDKAGIGKVYFGWNSADFTIEEITFDRLVPISKETYNKLLDSGEIQKNSLYLINPSRETLLKLKKDKHD